MRNLYASFRAFSLAEAMIALLMISIVIAAMAPIMTKKIKLSQTGFSSLNGPSVKKYVVEYSDPTMNETADQEFIAMTEDYLVTLVGGGGAGGGSAYGEVDWRTPGTYTWTVPAGVTEIEATLVSGGTGGGAGAAGSGTLYGNSSIGSSYAQWTSPGVYSWTVPNDAKVPALPTECTNAGVTQWTVVADGSKISPGGASVSVTACGGGGGGGGFASRYTHAGGGGSGAVRHNVMRAVNEAVVSIAIGEGGQYGATLSGMASKGGNSGSYAGGTATRNSSCNSPTGVASQSHGQGGVQGGYSGGGYLGGNGGRSGGAGNAYWTDSGHGGGGGGETRFGAPGSTYELTSAGGGGGAGDYGGGGGGGGGGIGGGGGGCCLYCSPNFSTVSWIGQGSGGGYSGVCSGMSSYNGYPGGGGYPNGVTGSTSSGGVISSSYGISTSYCRGGNQNGSGSSGYMKVSWTATANALKCSYNAPANGGSGGGAGGIVPQQKIKVTPGEVLTIVVGKGNAGGTAAVPDVSYTESSSLKRGTAFLLDTNWILGYLPTGHTGSWGPYGGKSNGGCPSGEDPGEITGGAGGGMLSVPGYSIIRAKNANNNAPGVGCPYGSESPTGGDGGATTIAKQPAGWCTAGKGGTVGSKNGQAPAGFGGCGGGGGYANSLGGAGAGGYARITWGGGTGGGGGSGAVVNKKPLKLAIGQTYQVQVGAKGRQTTGEDGGNGGQSGLKIKGATTFVSPEDGKGGFGGKAGKIAAGAGGLAGGPGGGNGTAGVIILNTTEGAGGFGGSTAIYTVGRGKDMFNQKGIGGCGGLSTTTLNEIICNSTTANAPAFLDANKPYGAGGGGGGLQSGAIGNGADGFSGYVRLEWE